jgi:hypothetical protein
MPKRTILTISQPLNPSFRSQTPPLENGPKARKRRPWDRKDVFESFSFEARNEELTRMLSK